MFMAEFLTGSGSTFPTSIDQIPRLYTLPASEKQYERRYNALRNKTVLNFEEETELNNLNIRLQKYKLDAEKFNHFGDMVVATQKHYKEETEGYIEFKQLEFQAYVNNFQLRGEWSALTPYKRFNFVKSDGDLYIAKIDHTNQPPSNTAYWDRLSSKGDTGPVGLSINFQGAYDSSKTYTLGQAVTHEGLWYYATTSVTNKAPNLNPNEWALQNNQVSKSMTEPADTRLDWIDMDKMLYKVYNTTTSSRVPLKAIAIVNSPGTGEFDYSALNTMSSKIDTIVMATKAEAEAGVNSAKYMSPLRVLEAIRKFVTGGFTATGKIFAQSNTDNTVAQVRNVVLSTGDANLAAMKDGEIWIKYE